MTQRARPSRPSSLISRLVRRVAVLALALLALGGGAAYAEPATKVFLNGVPTPVFFNDGDSFRVLSGKFEGSKARLSGYNTLESYGPAHQWGPWTAHEMYVLAKMATANARDGVWHCSSDGKLDTYGRTLWWCPELAADQIRKGLAHVLSVDSKPGNPELIKAQDEAKAARRGMWAHGIPDFIVTSLHSMAEEVGDEGAYNRLVSTADGHSLKWVHNETYPECALVCDDGAEEKSRIDGAAAALAADPVVSAYIKGAGGARPYTEDELEVIASNFARKKPIAPLLKRPEQLAGFTAVLEKLVAEAKLGRVVNEPVACMIYVDFKRRFGGGRAACLR